ncbi:hypothetical protein ABMA28_010703 [Loxostege sticticalis]|uniref:Tc1-like transposase DDE domain-containing protein n=1 Tax=Loxostege sticticalis TaxID=481309 RepID=A0ABD0SCY8_LOXSC
MNASNFNKWLREKLIPNLTEPSIIVMDNASYHTVQVNKAPNTSTRKAEIQNWLRCHDILFEETQSREELLCLVDKHKPEPIYEADQILKENGHEVLRLPPYHCDLNPIELIWSTGKRKAASKNISRSLSEMENLIKECFDSITPEEWNKMVNHILHIEENYKEKDGIVAEMESFIINVTDSGDDSSSSDSEDSMGVEYLESDFDYSE